MFETHFIDDFERTECADDFYGVLGRALCLATRFENTCKIIAMMSAMKKKMIMSSAQPDVHFNNEEIAEFVDELTSNLFKNIKFGNPLSKMNDAKELVEILHKAREARNEIAHQIGLNLIGSRTDSEIDGIMDIFKNYVYDLIQGDIVSSYVLSKLNGETILIDEIDYTKKVTQWVFEKYE